MEKTREFWVDNVKVFACILVVLGHFFQSMRAEIIPQNGISEWFIQTIYFFHVPLFFICSGYLYQKLSEIYTVSAWGKNVAKKALALGVPYFIFSSATWILKTLFSGAVNNEIGGYFDTLFLTPTAPYWYLYCLFFVFLITPTFKNKKIMVIGAVLALLMKLFSILWTGSLPYAVSRVLANEIWFVIGMGLVYVDLKKVTGKLSSFGTGVILGIVFIFLSIYLYFNNIDFPGRSFIMGIIACSSVVLIIAYIWRNNKQTAVFGFLSAYTMPIFLMHTIFAAPVRIALMKIGVDNVWIHIVSGIAISFVGPIIAGMILKKIKYFDFILYPTKYIKIK